MRRASTRVDIGVFATAVVVVGLGPGMAGGPAAADTIYLKNGLVYRSQGAPDRDATLLFLWDGLRKVVIRDSKVERIVADSSFRTGEKFQLVQPLLVHAGAMPKEVVSVEAGPWDDKGRRPFRYVGSRLNRPVSMEQAIVEIGPHLVRFRGIDGFWVGQVATSQVPREVILGILARVDQENQAERERVVRFLMDAGWNSEARRELDRLIQDFPNTELSERAEGAKAYLVQAEAAERRREIDVLRRAQQFRKLAKILASLESDPGLNTELMLEVKELARREEEQRTADRGLATDLRRLLNRLSAASREAWQKRVEEAITAIEEAPDAVRERFASWRQATAEPDRPDAELLALAMSGFVVGSEAATSRIELAESLWQARELVRRYLIAPAADLREELIAELDALDWPADDGPPGYAKLDRVTRLVLHMRPPLHAEGVEPETLLGHRVTGDDDDAPTDYLIQLPPEYHPLRSYPALIVLHSGNGPRSAIEGWAGEAARRGYVVIAPEYGLPGQPPDYRYSPSESAAVVLALRDARRRYAIDSDRVFVAGQLTGGNMAWDFGLAHPDQLAGIIVVSGFPAKYVPRYLPHHERLPLYFIIGDLAPAASEVIYGTYLKPLILKSWDVTYVEYHRRGLEEFPEEIPALFDWMDRHRRDPVPKSFEVVSARTSDARFYGVFIPEFAEGRTTAPEAVEILGANLSPASLKVRSSVLSNLLNVQVSGVKRLVVWVSPRLIDFKRKLEIRVNGKPYFKGQPTFELEPLLEDLRLRGDRQQIYWMKVSAG